MRNFWQALWVEGLKARRTKMPLFTMLAYALLPLVGGFFMIILRDPQLARQVGLISAKAQLTMGAADWPTYFEFLSMGNAIAGLIISGLIASWVFGRESADRTLKDLLALPTQRSAMVVAKLVMIFAWTALLSLLSILVGFAVGAAVSLPIIPIDEFIYAAANLALTSALTILLVTPVTLVASAGRGYLPPMGFVILAVVAAQVIAVIGYGEYFPWTIPGLLSQGDSLKPHSLAIVLLTGISGVIGVVLWWEYADHTR